MASLVKNGDFRKYPLSANDYRYDEAVTNTKRTLTLFPDWYFKSIGTPNSGAVLSNGHSAFGTEVLQPNEQCLVVQQGGAVGATLEVSQPISLKAGEYELTFKSRHREPVGVYNSKSHKLYVSVLNASETAMSKTEVPLSGEWQPKSYRFNVLSTNSDFDLCLTFQVPQGSIPNDTTIFVTSVDIKPVYEPPAGQVKSCDTFIGSCSKKKNWMYSTTTTTQQGVFTNNNNSYSNVFRDNANNLSANSNPVSDYYNFRIR
jgi:hypothetical protein